MKNGLFIKCHCFCVREVNQKGHGKHDFFLSRFFFYLRRYHILSTKDVSFWENRGVEEKIPNNISRKITDWR